jgi:hypothetical protein
MLALKVEGSCFKVGCSLFPGTTGYVSRVHAQKVMVNDNNDTKFNSKEILGKTQHNAASSVISWILKFPTRLHPLLKDPLLMPCGLQLTGGYRPKLNVATKAGMFTPFLGTKKAQKNIHVCWFNTPLAFWKTQKRIPLYPCWSYHVISVLTGVPNFLFPTPNLHNSRTVCCLNMPKPT